MGHAAELGQAEWPGMNNNDMAPSSLILWRSLKA